MGKYFGHKVAGYYLYFTAHCIVEPVHAHASDTKLTETGSAKIWVHENGETTVQNMGQVSEKDMKDIQRFIKKNIETIKGKWLELAESADFKSK